MGKQDCLPVSNLAQRELSNGVLLHVMLPSNDLPGGEVNMVKDDGGSHKPHPRWNTATRTQNFLVPELHRHRNMLRCQHVGSSSCSKRQNSVQKATKSGAVQWTKNDVETRNRKSGYLHRARQCI